MESLYFGERTAEGRCVVTVQAGRDMHPLNPRHDIRNHSPTGFEWGFSGSGPAQLALALLCHALGNVGLAEGCYQEFKREVVGGLPHEGWTLRQSQICDWWMRRLQLAEHDPSMPRCRDCYEGGPQ